MSGMRIPRVLHIQQRHRALWPFRYISMETAGMSLTSDDIGVEASRGASYTDRELEQFTHERMDEGVCVPWLFRTRDDPNTKNVVLSEALLWREIVVGQANEVKVGEYWWMGVKREGPA